MLSILDGMNFETHLILQEDPAYTNRWAGMIDDDWVLVLTFDDDGFVTEAVVRKNDVHWELPCDDPSKICQCVHLDDYDDATDDVCPWARPVLGFTSHTWTGSGPGMPPAEILSAGSFGQLEPEDGGLDLAKIRRPWICATDDGPVVVFDGVDTESPLLVPISS